VKFINVISGGVNPSDLSMICRRI